MSSKETKRLVGRLRTATNRWSTPAIGALRNFRWKIARADTGDAASGTRHSVIDLPPVPEAATQTRPSPMCSARPRAHAQLQPRGKYAPACVLATTTLAVYSRPERCTGSDRVEPLRVVFRVVDRSGPSTARCRVRVVHALVRR